MKYNNEKVSLHQYVGMCVCVCVLQVFNVTQYCGHFKSKFDAVKNKVGLLLEKIKTSIPQPMYKVKNKK